MPAASARGRQSRGAGLQLEEEEMAKWTKEAGAHGVPVAQARRQESEQEQSYH